MSDIIDALHLAEPVEVREALDFAARSWSTAHETPTEYALASIALSLAHLARISCQEADR